MSRFAKFATGLRDFGSDLNANIVKALNIPKASEDPKDALLEEARTGRTDGINAVLEGSVSVSDFSGALDDSFLSPLCLACRGGHEEASLLLLRRADADPNNALGASRAAAAAAAIGQAYGKGADEDPAAVVPPPTPLALAVEAGLRRVVKELLARGARVDVCRAGDGWTALHLCAKTGNALVMELLLGAPLADAGVRAARLETPLSVACFYGHLSVVDMLLGGDDNDALGAGISSAGARNAASVGGSGGRSSTALVAIDAPAPVATRGSRRHAEEKTWTGRTPLHQAALQGHSEVVLRLLAHGVNPDPTDFRGATPLHLASVRGRWGAARELVRRGVASVLLTTGDGDTVLHAAAWSAASAGSAARGVKLLLESGAEVDARNRLGSTALHLAAAAADHDSVALLLAAGANPSVVNSCGLSPGTCFLGAPDAAAVHASGAATAASQQHVKEIRQALREHRGKLGHIRRLADASTKRVAVEAVADKATASVHRFVEFSLKVQRWDLDARAHRSRLRRLNKFRSDILADPFRPAATESNSLLLDMSPGRESRAARAVEGRRKAAAGAIKGAKLALRDLADWKKDVLAERGAVVTFMRRADPALAFAAGASCGGSGGDGHVLDGYGGGAGTVDDAGPRAKDVEVDVVVADPSFLAKQEGVGGWAGNEGGRLRRHASWAETGGETGSSSDSSPTSVPANADSGDGRVERPVRDRSGSRGSFGGPGGGGSGGRSRTPAAGFLRALGALDPCVSALREARSSAKTGDRLSMALETLREHVKATLIDLMDLETSIPGEGAESEEEESANVGGGGGGDSAGSVSALTAAEAGSLDVKVAGLVRRLSGKEAGGDGTNSNAVDEAGNNVGGGGRGPPSLASVYEGGLRGAAEASEAEVDTTESLTARALGMVLTAVAGPLLWALDDAYQRLVKADLELRRLLPEAEALVGGAGSAEELAREARGRLVTVRQQVVDEQDLLKELVSKLKRRRRQAAEQEEIRSIDDERLHVLARVSALRSAKLSELKALRRSGAYNRFPELILEHPDPAESAFRTLLLSGIDVRDADEWGEHHLTSVASVESVGDGVGNGGGVDGAGGRMLAGLGGQGCRLAEIDGSAVVLVEVECRDRQAERALVADLLSFHPRTRRLPPEVATVSAVALQDGKAFLEVGVEGALTAKAWLAATTLAASCGRNVAGGDVALEPGTDEGGPRLATADGMDGKEATAAAGGSRFTGEDFQVGVWAVMVQALRGLAAVHALRDGSVHRAVCLANVLVAARSTPNASAPPPPLPPAFTAAVGGGGSAPAALPHGFRRAQLGPPAPAALARPSSACVAPEVVRGREFCQPADVYAFGCALRAACCGAQHPESHYATGGGGGGGSGGAAKKLPVGLGPAPGPLREALVQVLERMLEEDAACRCTALEALSSDYFRAPPLRSPNPAYPLRWSPFPVRSRQVSSTAPGSQPHWVAVALAGGLKGEAPTVERGWFDSAFAVEIPSAASAGGVRGPHEGLEGVRVEALLRRSLPGARLRRLVRFQDRARMLRFVCERDAAVSSAVAGSNGGGGGGVGGAADSQSGGVSVSTFFADPRDVLARDALTTIAAAGGGGGGSASTAGVGGKSGTGWTVGGTPILEEDEGGDTGGARGKGGDGPTPTALVRCTEDGHFAAVAFAPPPTEPGGDGEADGGNWRTVAVVRGVVGVPREGTGVGGDAGGAARAVGLRSEWVEGPSRAGGEETDPFSGVDCKVDDLTRVGGIGLSSPTLSLGDGGGGDLKPEHARGLASRAVATITTRETVSGEEREEQGPWRKDGGGAAAAGAAVHWLRQDCCYPEYLATFSL